MISNSNCTILINHHRQPGTRPQTRHPTAVALAPLTPSALPSASLPPIAAPAPALPASRESAPCTPALPPSIPAPQSPLCFAHRSSTARTPPTNAMSSIPVPRHKPRTSPPRHLNLHALPYSPHDSHSPAPPHWPRDSPALRNSPSPAGPLPRLHRNPASRFPLFEIPARSRNQCSTRINSCPLANSNSTSNLNLAAPPEPNGSVPSPRQESFPSIPNFLLNRIPNESFSPGRLNFGSPLNLNLSALLHLNALANFRRHLNFLLNLNLNRDFLLNLSRNLNWNFLSSLTWTLNPMRNLNFP